MSFSLLTEALFFHVIHFIQTMTTSTLKSVKLVKDTSAWTLTRFSDSLFIARNTWGKKHVFRCGAEMTHFEDFLLKQGFKAIESGRSLSTLKRVA